MIDLIRRLLVKTINDIDAGNSELTDEDALKLIDILKEFSVKNVFLSKYQAYNYLNISRATFDNYVREGKLPKGKKRQGFKELGWYRKDLDEYIEKSKGK